MVSRRRFVAGMAVGAGVLALGSFEAFDFLGRNKSRLTELPEQAFRSVRQRAFEVVDTEGRRFPMHLASIEACRMPAQDRREQWEQLSLIFHVSPDSRIASGMRVVDHPELGRGELFLTEVDAPRGRRHLQAVFVRHAEGSVA